MIRVLGVDVFDDPNPHLWGTVHASPVACGTCGQPVVRRLDNGRRLRVVWVEHDRAYPDKPHSSCMAELLPHTEMDCVALRWLEYPSEALRAYIAEQEKATERSVTE